MDSHRIKHDVLDYLYDLIGHSEVLESTEKNLRATILNRLPLKIPSYLSEEINASAEGIEGKNFSNFLVSMGILSAPGQAVERESFIYLKNKAELENPGKTLFN